MPPKYAILGHWSSAEMKSDRSEGGCWDFKTRNKYQTPTLILLPASLRFCSHRLLFLASLSQPLLAPEWLVYSTWLFLSQSLWPQEILATGSLPTWLTLCLCEREGTRRENYRDNFQLVTATWSPFELCPEVPGSQHRTCLWREGKRCSVMPVKGSDATWMVRLITL